MTKEEILQKSKGIQGWLKDSEAEALYTICENVLKSGDVALEVGSWKGKSSIIIASVCAQKGARLICVDTFTGSELNEAHYQEAADMGAQKFIETYIAKNLKGLPVSYIIGNSTKAHVGIENESVTFCFIDGNHCHPVIDADLENYWPKVKVGGIFAGHDYSRVCPDVIEAFDKKFPNEPSAKHYADIITITKS